MKSGLRVRGADIENPYFVPAQFRGHGCAETGQCSFGRRICGHTLHRSFCHNSAEVHHHGPWIQLQQQTPQQPHRSNEVQQQQLIERIVVQFLQRPECNYTGRINHTVKPTTFCHCSSHGSWTTRDAEVSSHSCNNPIAEFSGQSRKFRLVPPCKREACPFLDQPAGDGGPKPARGANNQQMGIA